MDGESRTVVLSDATLVTAKVTLPTVANAGWQFIYAPGAGSNINDPFGAFASGWLAERGVACVRFQFPYMEQGRRRPDPPAVLRATWQAAIAQCRAPRTAMVVGGRSMGGRIASEVVASGAEVDRLALFAYPLYAPGRPTVWRDKHLASITVPTLFCSGTRDTMSSVADLAKVAATVTNAMVHLLEGADHGFRTLKSSGLTREDVWLEAVTALWDWLARS